MTYTTTINEIKKSFEGHYAEVEIYKYTSQRRSIHTDFIKEIDFSDLDFNKTYKMDVELMDEEEYNETVLANSGMYFDDIFDHNQIILVIVIVAD